MKTNSFFQRIVLISTILLWWVFAAQAATPYCQETSPNANFTFSLMHLGSNNYRIQFDAVGDDKFVSVYNINCGVNQSGGAGIFFGGDNASKWVITDDRAYFDFATASESSTPTGFYANYFCFNKKGGGLIEISGFNPSDVDWTATCGAVDETEYTITVIQPVGGGGSISADLNKAKQFTTVTLTATPNDGKDLDAWDVKDADNNVITVTKNKFLMPASNVTVTATFKDHVELTPATYYGADSFYTEGAVINPKKWTAVEWNITRNANQTLTFVISWTGDVDGMVPQITIPGIGDYIGMTVTGKTATYTTTNLFDDGYVLSGAFFYLPYAGAAKRIDIVYTVGAENAKPETPVEPGTGTSIDVIQENVKALKVIENGQILIVRDGETFNVLGTRVR